MSLQQEIRGAYGSLIEASEAYHEARAELQVFEEEVVAENFESLKQARSNDARSQTIAALMVGNEQYERARDALSETRMKFEIAKYRVEMVRLIASLEGGGE